MQCFIISKFQGFSGCWTCTTSIANVDLFLEMSQARRNWLIHMIKKGGLILELFCASWTMNR